MQTNCLKFNAVFSVVDEALYYWIDSSRLRLILTEQLDDAAAKRIKEIRPTPNNFVVISKTEQMKSILETVESESLLDLPERWNFVFLDFDARYFDFSIFTNKPVNILYFSQEMCCNFLMLSNCTCPKGYNFNQRYYELIFEELAKIFEDLKGNFKSNINCNETGYENGTFDAFRRKLKDALLESKIILYKGNMLSLKLVGSIDTVENDTLKPIVMYDEVQGVTFATGGQVRPVKPFYRVGITHVRVYCYLV